MEYLSLITVVAKNPALDVLVIVFFLAAGFFWGMMGGKSKLLSFLLATYLALFISPLAFEFLDQYKIAPHPYRNLTVHVAVFALLFIVCERVLFRGLGRASFKWWQAFVISFLAVGIFIAGTLNIISLKGIIKLSPLVINLFAGSSAYLFWAIAPLVGLLLFSRK